MSDILATGAESFNHRETAGVSKSSLRKAVAAAIIGNGLEWYDYMLYGFFSIFIAQAFFPGEDPFVQTLLTFLTFSFAFFFRPLGGLLLGTYSDRFGRKPALTLMILMMGVATVMIGLTPSYASIGLLATLLIVFARIIQGLSVGGEFGGATAMLVEYAPASDKLFYGSFQMVSQALATVLAAGLGLLVVTGLSESQVAEWGWRALFLLGGLIAPIGFYIRSKVPETPEFVRSKQQNEIVKAPLIVVFKEHPKALLAGLGLVAIGGASNYVWFVYMTIFVVHELELPVAAMFASDLIAGLILMALVVVCGRLCDRIGGWRIFIVGVILFGASSYPLFAYVVAEPSFARLITAQAIGSCFMALIWAPTPGVFATLFPTNIRATGMSIAYNLGVILFGAMAPVLLTILTKMTGSKMMPAYYILACALLSLILLALSRDVIVSSAKRLSEGQTS